MANSRRIHIEQLCLAEELIRIAMRAVEDMGASEKLTTAVVQLDEAFNSVADHYDKELES